MQGTCATFDKLVHFPFPALSHLNFPQLGIRLPNWDWMAGWANDRDDHDRIFCIGQNFEGPIVNLGKNWQKLSKVLRKKLPKYQAKFCYNAMELSLPSIFCYENLLLNRPKLGSQRAWCRSIFLPVVALYRSSLLLHFPRTDRALLICLYQRISLWSTVLNR